MKITIIGVGGVGGFFGGLLAKAGHDVTFLTRGKTLNLLKREGLFVNSYLGDFHLTNLKVTDDPASITSPEIIILAVKSWQVEETVQLIKPLLNDDTVVIPLQNGVDAPSLLSRELGIQYVLPAMCRVVAFKTEPNKIQHTDVDPFIALGEKDNRETERIAAIAAILRASNININIPKDIHSVLWQKFLFVTTSSGIGALTRVPMGIIRKVKESRSLFENSLKEIDSLAKVKNINLPKDIVEKSLDYLDILKPDSTSSTQRDIMEGRPSELEALTGAVVRMGREVSVPTPLSSYIYSALLPMEMIARGKIESIKYNYTKPDDQP